MRGREPLPPGPRGRALFGSLREIRRDRIRFVTEATAEFGDVVSFTMGPRRIYLLRHPDHFRHVLSTNAANYVKGLGLQHAGELLGEGLLTSQGERWERQRRTAVPALADSANLAAFARRVAELGATELERWERCNAPFDAARRLTELGVSIAGDALLGRDLSADAARIADDLRVITADAISRMTAILPSWRRMSRRSRAALLRLEATAAGGPLREPCFPGLLGDAGSLRDQALTFLLAGHETTAATLAWALLLLARHPQAQERLQAEVDRELGGRAPELADLAGLPYAAMTLHETMRLYPAVWLLPRRSLADDRIGGYRIPARSDVLLSVYSMHRHPDFWPEPDRFLPERFASGAPSAAYMPFGAGPRACVGRRAGVVETTVLLAMIAARFHCRAAPPDSVRAEAPDAARAEPAAAARAEAPDVVRPEPADVRSEALLTLHPEDGVWLQVERRGSPASAEKKAAPVPAYPAAKAGTP
jgi:cytochrome P450